MIKHYRMADQVISVESIYENVHFFCAAYETDEPADMSVIISKEDIAAEREKAAREDRKEGIQPRNWSDTYLEELAVYRKIAEQMPFHDTLLIHGSALAVDGQAYLFTAPSGTGKSTHAKIWRQQFGERAVVINDDKPLLHIDEDRAVIYGTPYDGKHRLSTNTSAPLKAVCFLKRGMKNSILPLTGQEAYPRLLAQTYRPEKGEMLAKTLLLLNRLTKLVSFYELSCNMDPEAALVAYTGMNPVGICSEYDRPLSGGKDQI